MKMRLKEGTAFEDVKIAGHVVQRTRTGKIVVYPKPVYRRRKAAPQGANAPMARVAALWARVDLAGMERWQAYARVLHLKEPRPGGPMPAYNAFVKAMMGALAQAPDAEPSLEPPFPPFRGDRIGIAVEPLPQPPLQDEPLGEGAVRITASYRNRTGVRTEVLARRLDETTGEAVGESVRVWEGAFANRSLTRTVALAAGAYAFEARFVEAATGRATAAEGLGTVVVGTPTLPSRQGEATPPLPLRKGREV